MSQRARREDSRFDMASNVSIVGIGQSRFSRRSDDSIQELILGAVLDALADAGLSPDDVDGVVTESDLVPQLLDDHDLCVNLGLGPDVFTARSGLGGPGIVSAPLVAALAIKERLATTVVSYFASIWGRTNGAYGFHGQDPLKASLEMPHGFYGQPTYFGALANRYIHDYGLTPEQLAAVSISSRQWSSMNPAAQRQQPLTMESYLASPMISDPLRLPDCCLLTDGAVAFVMTSPERAKDLRQPPVTVAAVERAVPSTSIHSYLTQHPTPLMSEIAIAGPRAMAAAGITPADVDLVNIYDCFSITLMLQLEDLGFCRKGEAGELFASGATAPGGRLPVNTHGGMLSEAYLLGINNITEGVRQLRGQAEQRQVPGAEVAVVSAYEHAALVLTRGR